MERPDAPGHDARRLGSLDALVHDLARRASEAWRHHGYDESAFGSIASEALERSQLVGAITWETLQEHILAPASPEPLQSEHPAPEVIPLYNGRHFKIYAHAWLDKIAEPHHHSWTGAFQVLEGRSLNGYYGFTPTDSVRQGLTIGRLTLARRALHGPGTVVAVNPGAEFIHGLQYLDRPGLAISIRGGRLIGSTCTYYRPGIAVRTDLKDPAITSMLRVLQILYHTDLEAFERQLLESIPRCDLMAIHLIVFEAIRSGWTLPATVFARATEVFGPRFSAIQGAADELSTLGKIVQLRSRFTDPDLRFFLAALCLGDDRQSVFELAREYAPQRDPRDLIGQWLTSLLIDAEGRSIPEAMARGLGRLALGEPAEDVGTSVVEDQLGVIVSAHAAMAEAPIYRPLFRGTAIPG